ncbi:MAG: hydrogenase maturation protease [Desulfobacteraceae bacterium]|nr:hydrogenase maturation protease [Desulfobacteraceae bacterium]
MTTLIYGKEVLILGCGNTLFGNDGFGPKVIQYLNENYSFPDYVLPLDAGTGIRDYIFDLLLMEDKPKQIFVIDAVTVMGKKTGELFEMSLTDVPKEKLSDFSLHQSPSSNLLSELKESGVDIRVYCVHTDTVPNVIEPGLSGEVEKAVPKACEWINEQISINQ